MIDALRYESVRIRTIGSTYWTLLLGLLLCGLIALGFGIDTRGTKPDPCGSNPATRRRRREPAVLRTGVSGLAHRNPVDRPRIPVRDDLPDADRDPAAIRIARRQGTGRRFGIGGCRGDRHRPLLADRHDCPAANRCLSPTSRSLSCSPARSFW